MNNGHSSEADRAMVDSLRDERDLWRGRATEAERLRDQARRFATAPAVDLDRDMRDDSLHGNQVEAAQRAQAWFALNDAHAGLNDALEQGRASRREGERMRLRQAQRHGAGGAA